MAVTKQFTDLPAWVKGMITLGNANIPFLRLVGFDTGAAIATAMEFEMGQVEAAPSGAQPAITEDQAVAGATATVVARTPEKNCAQIFQKAVSVSTLRQSLTSGLTGLDRNNGASEIDPATNQINAHLRQMYADMNYSVLFGTKNVATASNEAWKMGGLFPQVIAGGNKVDAAGAALSKELVNALFLAAANGGAEFMNMALVVSASNKQKISAFFGVQPSDRTIGGIAISQIATDFGNVSVIWDRTVPDTYVGLFDLAKVRPVFVPVPTGELILVEKLAKTGAAENWQIYSQASVDFGSAKLHGVLHNLA